MKKLLVVIFISLLIVLFFLNFNNFKPRKPVEFYIKSKITHPQLEIFTKEEQRWINENKDRIFRVGVAMDYVPIEYLDRNDEPKGLGIEIIKKTNQFTGLKFKVYENSHLESWAEILQNTQEKRIDILPTVSFTEKRGKYLEYSLPYLEMTQVIVGHKDKKLINSFNKLQKVTFVVPKGYWLLDTILKEYPVDKIIQVENMEEALSYIANRKADYAICELPVYTYYQEKGRYNSLKIVGELEKKNLAFIGVRKEFSLLVPIINKVIKEINYDELYESALVMPQDDVREKELIALVSILATALLLAIYYLCLSFKKLALAKTEAETANKDKTMLMANISHDLRTPITVTMGYLEAIIDGEVGKNEDKERYIKRAYERLKYLSDLINDFFLLSRLEDNKLTLYKEKVNINKLIKNIPKNVELKAKSMNVKFIIKLDKTINNMKIDKLKIYRAIENIIMNAIKYSKDNGKIEIGTIALKDGKTKIYIRDYGIGIHKEDIPNIFKRYNKAKNSKKGSIGLGLYITKEIIEKHNGQIWVESELNVGSTFYIVL